MSSTAQYSTAVYIVTFKSAEKKKVKKFSVTLELHFLPNVA